MDGTLKEHGKTDSLDVTLEAIDLGQVTPLTQMLEVPMEGSLGGTVSLEMPDGRLTKAVGSVALEADDVAVGDGKAKLMGKMAVPRLTLGTFSLIAEIKDGTVKGRSWERRARTRLPRGRAHHAPRPAHGELAGHEHAVPCER